MRDACSAVTEERRSTEPKRPAPRGGKGDGVDPSWSKTALVLPSDISGHDPLLFMVRSGYSKQDSSAKFLHSFNVRTHI